jgi:hypothetical protein
MGRRDQDPRPPVEVLGAEGPGESLQRVAVGGGERGRGKGALAAVAVVAVLLVGLAIDGEDEAGAPARGEDDAEEGTPSAGGEDDGSSPRVSLEEGATTTSRPRRATTTTVPVPILPGSDAQVLLVRGGRGSELLDLATGVSVGVDIGREAFSVVPVPGGVVAADRGQARYRDLPFGDPVDLGPADQVYGQGDGSSVWLVTGSFYEAGRTTEATLVDLSGRVLAGPMAIDQGWVLGAAGAGLLVQAGGRIYEIDATGDVRPIVSGEALGVSEGRLIARTCDDRAVCHMQVFNRELTAATTLDVPGDTGRYGATVVVHPDGRRAAVQIFGPEPSSVVLLDLEGGPPQVVTDLFGVSSVAWLPGDLGLLVVKPNDLLRVYQRGDKIMLEELAGRGADLVFVIGP